MVPNRRTGSLQARRKDRLVIDVSYVELPERVTHRINASGVLGGISFLSMLLAPGAVEGGRSPGWEGMNSMGWSP